MCGRFTMAIDADDLQTELALGRVPADWKPRYNVAPGQNIGVVTNPQSRDVTWMQWGLVPFWAKDPTIGNRLINARAGSLDEKPSFKYAFAKRRCLIVADGFYEWKKPESGAKSSRPFYFSLREGKAFVFAGLWESWQPKDDPESKLITCTIITTVANAIVAKVHDRMPVILNAEDKWAWLREDNPAALKALLKPALDDLLQAWEVSRAVNDPKNDSPECIKPLQEGFGGA